MALNVQDSIILIAASSWPLGYYSGRVGGGGPLITSEWKLEKHVIMKYEKWPLIKVFLSGLLAHNDDELVNSGLVCSAGSKTLDCES